MPQAPQVSPAAPESPGPMLPDPDQQAQGALFRALVVTVQHYFGGFAQLFQSLTDPRDPTHSTYSLTTLLVTGVLLFVFRLGARRQIAHLLRGNQSSAQKFQLWLDAPECPHGDTLNAAYRRLAVAELQAVVTGMVSTLIRRRALEHHRLFDQYYLVAIDGTGVLTFRERHCAHCLTRTQQGHTTYYHPVLEAKLVTASGFAFSLMTEFIENPDLHPDKQDCELQAFYRLATRLKQQLPRLPLCLLLDGLYAGGPTFTLCETNGWKYLIVLQDGAIPYLETEFTELRALEPAHHLHFQTGVQGQTHQELTWVNQIAYRDTKGQDHELAVLECLETKPDPRTPAPKTTRFRWVSNFHVTRAKIVTLANQGGRLRWKIENEGFNVQKRGGYALEHRYTEHPNASKIFYLLLQIAHLLAQLVEKGSLFRQAFPYGVGSAKNIAQRLVEAWRNLRLTPAMLHQLLATRVQIRFDPP